MLAHLDIGLRGATIALALLFAFVAGRSGGQPAARFASIWGFCVAAYVAASSPVMGSAPLPVRIVFEPFVAATAPAFWVFARSWFDDGFRLRIAHWLIAALFVIVDLLHVFVLRGELAIKTLGIAVQFGGVGFAVAAAVAARRGWRDDLIEQRQRARNVFVILAAGLIAIAAFGGGAARASGLYASYAAVATLAFFVATFAILVHVLGLVRADLFGTASKPIERMSVVGRADDKMASGLLRMMQEERAYRDPALSIGRLAAQLGVPEYRLRRHINDRLGFRNFAAYLADHRIAEAKTGLADPQQRDVSILTIALDTGFGSLPPFNRAFKAATGITPTAYRKAFIAAR